MADITSIIIGIFNPTTVVGGLICIFLLFYIDAIIFPTVPELFTVGIYASQDQIGTLPFGLLILGTVAASEVLGFCTLYYVVRKVRVPKLIQKGVDKFQAFLIYPDERMILVNRVAPIVPFLGAFASICHWNLRKSIKYVLIGGMAKYGLILLASGLFIAYWDRGTATIVVLVLVIGVIIASFIASYHRKKRMTEQGGKCLMPDP
jgi:membrane protein YqaA with SNARE-associated domain